MSEPIKQHYVPQTYLRNFSSSKNIPYQTFVLDKRKNNIFLANIKNIASERHFYTLKNHQDKFRWENYYAEKIEPLTKDVVSQILSQSNSILLNDKATVLTPELKARLSFAIYFQLLRGKHTRDIGERIVNFALSVIIENAREVMPTLDFEGENFLKTVIHLKENFKSVEMEVIVDIESSVNFAHSLLQRSFVIFKIIGDLEFVTSDHPVMFMNSSSLSATPFRNGLVHDTTVVFYPLSSKIVMAAYHPSFAFGELINLDMKIKLLDSNRESKFVDLLNRKQYEQSHSQIYAKRRNVIESLAKRMRR